mmetsp:Transcript_13652/g.40268  ORF Transcript_13652/g.40268 Transcript_13652/m.40268 type:complete len:516 (+) Transcript_13652:70-1617(+)
MPRYLRAWVFAVSLAGAAAEEIALKLGELTSGYVEEDDFLYYAARIPKEAGAVKVIITPIFGDPDLYLSFHTVEPDDTSATWVMDEMGTEERLIRRSAAEFCQSEPCTLHLSVYGYEAAEFRLAVYNTSDISKNAQETPMCAPSCNEFDLSDGICDKECNTTACFFDGGDCLVTHSRGTCDWRTRAGCPSSWIGDGVCDEECFVEECEWDGNDCANTQSEEICHAGCMSSWINDGECDEECNNEECNFDGADCAHAASDCYHDKDGADYRGQVHVTTSGIECMKWTGQFPHQHTLTHQNYPSAGLGGHNYCRNPDGKEDRPFCFTENPAVRWEYCDVPEAFAACLQNEVPHAVQLQAAIPCYIDGPTPSGPLVKFKEACGETGDNSTYGDICSRDCCNAAEQAALRCPTDPTYRDAYAQYVMDVQWTMLQHECTSCRVYKQFFENANMLGSIGGPAVAGFVQTTGFKVLLVSGVIILALLLAIACVIARFLYARKNYNLQTADVEAFDDSDEDEF